MRPWRQRGIATLGVSLAMLLLITLGAILTAHIVQREQRAMASDYRAIKAAAAAEAGLEWGLAQLGDAAFLGALVVDANPVDDWLDANAHQAPAGLLPTDVGFNVVFTNPVAKDFKLLTLTSVGCADGCSPCDATCPIHRTASVQVKMAAGIFPKALRSAITAKNLVTLTLNAKSTNLFSNLAASDRTVWSGGAATYSNGAGTVSATGSYNTSASDPSTRQNDTSLSSATTDTFFQMFFTGTQAEVQASITNVACGSNCNTQLKGVTGQAMWITTNLVLSDSNTTIGSLTQPVILITTQDCQFTGSNTIYGVVYCRNLTGTGTATKVSTIHGGVIVQNNFAATKIPDVVYNPTVMSNLVSRFGGSGSGTGKIAGSWKDFP